MEEKNAILIGASETFGFFTARKLLHAGFKVTINSRKEDKLSSMKRELESEGEIHYLTGDVSSASTLKSIMDRYGDNGLDAVIFGLGGYDADDIENPKSLREMFENNVFLPFETFSAILSIMRNPSSAIFISSVYSSLIISEHSLSYSGSKAALNIMVASSAKMLLKRGIRVNAVMTTSMEEKRHTDRSILFNPGKQSIDPDLVANVVTFLAGETSMGITGSVITVDQGFSLR
ncbi:hypothetical protein DMB44_05555 [Thermoplasma sp. Kam2015]|uniref:SDR family oxidoreductase n=1 Tax=Thermoplasma sp. Kam2015 TaxID=2094122 RepID=UPI000D9D6D5B|nr:SDR family oxidoreductase [Thermoplasma sp. Kam2015]PYB67979.1 hypothetical protein DMB44_05555 [Thermoplasma sp. Kam2015]